MSVAAGIVSLVLIWKAGSAAVHDLNATSSLEEVRLECADLQGRIDSLVEESRLKKVQFSDDDASSPPDLASSCGLSLVEFSVISPSGKRGNQAENKWRMICIGHARSWGRFLASVEHSRLEVSLESGTWSCRGAMDTEVRGELVLVPAR